MRRIFKFLVFFYVLVKLCRMVSKMAAPITQSPLFSIMKNVFLMLQMLEERRRDEREPVSEFWKPGKIVNGETVQK